MVYRLLRSTSQDRVLVFGHLARTENTWARLRYLLCREALRVSSGTVAQTAKRRCLFDAPRLLDQNRSNCVFYHLSRN